MTLHDTDCMVWDLMQLAKLGGVALSYPWKAIRVRLGKARPGDLVAVLGDTVRTTRTVLRAVAAETLLCLHPGPVLYYCCGASPASVVEELLCRRAIVDRSSFRRHGARFMPSGQLDIDDRDFRQKLVVAGSRNANLDDLGEAVEHAEPRAVFVDTAVAPDDMGTDWEPNSFVTSFRELAETWSVPVMVAARSGESPWTRAVSAQADAILVASACDRGKRTGRIVVRVEKGGGSAATNGTAVVTLDLEGNEPEDEEGRGSVSEECGQNGRPRSDSAKPAP